MLRITVENPATEEVFLALDRLAKNADGVALDLRDIDGSRVEPIEYNVVSPIAPQELQRLGPGESKIIDVRGFIEEKVPGVVALVFPRATYRLSRERAYSAKVRWGDFESVPITIRL